MIYLELEQWTTTLPMIPTASSGRRLFLGRGRTGGRRRLNHLVGGVAGTGAATGAVVGTGDGRSNCRMYELSAWKTRFGTAPRARAKVPLQDTQSCLEPRARTP